MTIQELQVKFPPKTAHAFTGHIPIEWAKEHAKELKQAVSGHKLRRVYRGPRLPKGTWYGAKSYESFTRPENSYAVVFYKRSKTLEEWQAEYANRSNFKN